MCSEDACASGATTRGLCGMHYARRKRAGTLPPRLTVAQRFWAQVDKDGPVPAHAPHLGPCWLWTGAHDHGYGRFGADGKKHYPHRLSFTWATGREAPGDVDHECRTTLCVRPSHLREATRAENNQHHGGGPQRNNRSSRYRGVTWDKRSGRWKVQVMHNYRSHYGGSFTDEDEAGEAARLLRLRLHTRNDMDRLAS